MYKIVSAYQTSDGALHFTEDKAKNHTMDMLGQALDDLLPRDDRGNVTQADRYNLLNKQLNDSELLNKIENLYDILTFKD